MHGPEIVKIYRTNLVTIFLYRTQLALADTATRPWLDTAQSAHCWHPCATHTSHTGDL